MSAPDLWTLAFRDWSFAPVPDVLAMLVAGLYLGGVRRVRDWPWARSLFFALGLAAGLVAVGSGIDAYDDRLLSDHMVQHLLLLELAPLLLLAGRPGILALRAAPPPTRPRLARGLVRLRPFTHPLTCLVVFTVVVLGTHVPAFYDATVHHPLLHDLEHALYLGAGLLIWWPVLDGDPVPGRRLSGIARLGYVMAAMVPMTALGAWLNRDPSVFYSAYAAPARALGVSAVADQQVAGAIMWVLGSTVMIAAGIWQAMAAMAAEERRQEAADRRADGLALGAPEARR